MSHQLLYVQLSVAMVKEGKIKIKADKIINAAKNIIFFLSLISEVIDIYYGCIFPPPAPPPTGDGIIKGIFGFVKSDDVAADLLSGTGFWKDVELCDVVGFFGNGGIVDASGDRNPSGLSKLGIIGASASNPIILKKNFEIFCQKSLKISPIEATCNDAI